MAIAFDAASVDGGVGTGDRSWTHTPVGTPKGVLVLVAVSTQADEITTCTYGGVDVPQVALSPVLHNESLGENGGVHAFYLGTGIPTGAQTVLVSTSGTSQSKRAGCITYTASSDTEVVDTSSTQGPATANPSVTLSLASRSCACALVWYSGQGAVTGVTPLTNWTTRHEQDWGADTGGWYTYDIVGTTDVTAGYTAGSDNYALLGIAASEAVSLTSTTQFLTMMGCGT